MQAVCLIFNEDNTLDNFLCGNDWKNSQKLLCLQAPINSKVIDKYFTDDEELETIQDAMVEKPQIFDFDHVFKTQNINEFFEQYISKQLDEKIEGQNNLVYFLFSTSFLNSFWLSEEIKNEESFFINFIFEKILQNNESEQVQVQGNFVYQDLIQDIFEDKKITITNMQELVDIFGALNKNLQNFMYKSDLEQELEQELILFLKFTFQDDSCISFFIIPEDSTERDVHDQTIYKCMISLENFLQKNVIGQSPKFQSFANIKNQMKENQNLQVQQILNDHIYDNFDAITIFALEGNEDNYQKKVFLLKYLSDICKKFTIKAQPSLQKHHSPQFENEQNNEEVVQNLKSYINQLENKLYSSQKFEQNQSQNQQGYYQSQMVSDQNSLQQDQQNQELKESNIQQRIRLNLSQTLSKNFQRTQSYHRNQTQQDDNFYKVFKEKLARKDDINKFKNAELVRENKFLKISFTKQNKNFESLKQKLAEVNNQLNLQKNQNQDQKNEILNLQRKNKELQNKSVLLKSSWDVMKEKIGQMERSQRQNNQIFYEQNYDKKTELQKTQIQLDMQNKQTKKLNKELLKKDLEIQQLKNDLKQSSDKNQNLSQKLLENDKEFSIRHLQKEQILKDYDILNKNLDNEIQAKQQLLQQIQRLEENNRQLVLEHENQIRDYKEDHNKLKMNYQAIIQKKDEELKKLNNELLNCQIQIKEKDLKIVQNNDLIVQQNQIQEQVKQHQQQITQLEKQIIEKESQIKLDQKVLQFEIDKKQQIQEKYDKKTEQQKETQQKLQQLEQNYHKSQVEIKNLRKTLENNTEKIKNLSQENSVLNNNLNQQKQKEDKYIKEYEDKFEGVLYQLQQLQQQNTNLEYQIDQKKKDYDNIQQILQKKKEKVQLQKSKIEQYISIQDKYKEELREKINLIHKIQSEKEKKVKKTVQKVAMVSDIRNMIECYKHLSNNQFFQQTRIKQSQS